jgi:hypothetical protein
VDVVTFRLEERVSPCTKGGVLRYDVCMDKHTEILLHFCQLLDLF